MYTHSPWQGIFIHQTNRHDGAIDSSHTFQSLSAAKFTEIVVEMNQVHGTHCELVSAVTTPHSKFSATDSLITNQPNLALLIKTADCLPIILYDPITNSVAAMHAGWRGLIAGSISKTIDQMNFHFGTISSNLKAYIGPAIRSCCYAFDTRPNQADDLLWQPYINYHTRWHIDLIGYARAQLSYTGIAQKNIADSGVCTYHQSADYFSYFHHKHHGSAMGTQATVVQLTHD